MPQRGFGAPGLPTLLCRPIWALHTMTGTHRGPLRGVQPTGRQVRYPIVAMYRVANGLITEAGFVSDDLRMMRQIGGVST